MTDANWYALYNRMVNLDCPICVLLAEKCKEYLFYCDTLEHSAGNDDSFAPHMLCDQHFQVLIGQSPSNSINPICYEKLHHNVQSLLAGTDIIQQGKQSASCPVCERVHAEENYLIAFFVRSYANPNFSSRYTDQGVLCFRHLARILALDHSAEQQHIQEATIKKYQTMLSRMTTLQQQSNEPSASRYIPLQEPLDGREVVPILVGLACCHQYEPRG